MTLTFRLAPDSDLTSPWLSLRPGPRRVRLNPSGAALAAFLHAEPRTLSDIFTFAEHPDVDEATTREDAMDFLRDLSHSGALERCRTRRPGRRVTVSDVVGLPFALAAWFDYGLLGVERARPGPGGVLLLTLKSQAFLLVAALVATTWVGALPALLDSPQTQEPALVLAGALLAFASLHVALIAVHELAHWLLARRLSGDALAVRRGLVVSVLYVPGRPADTAITSAAGPLVAGTVGVVTAVLLLVTFGTGESGQRTGANLALASGLLAALHLLALNPWVGDGRALFRALRTMGRTP